MSTMPRYEKISVFDLDKTLIVGNSSSMLLSLLKVKKIPRRPSALASLCLALKYQFFSMSLTDLHTTIFDRYLKGAVAESILKHIPELIDNYIAKSIYQPAHQKFEEAKRAGHYTALYSSAPAFIVGPISDFFGFDEWKATDYHIDEKGEFSHVKSVFLGKDKASRLGLLQKELGIHPEGVLTYSDSILDLDFLKMSPRPCAVNPDRRLKKISTRLNWQLI